MATFYIQLENKLLKISGELTAENIFKAIGYVPADSSALNNYATKDEVSDLVDMSMVEELAQRVDNISFDNLKDNPFLLDGSGELNIVDESGNIIAKVDSEGIHSIDFVSGDHKLSDKADKKWVTEFVTETVTEGKVNLDGYATESWVENKGYAKQEDLDNIDFNTLKNTPFSDDENGELNIVDENNNIGLRLNSDGLYVKDVIAGDNILSNKVDKENGKGLSTEDFTTALKNKLQSLSNYDDTSITEAVNSLRTDFDTLVSGDTSTAIKTFNEIIAFLEGVEDTESLSGIIASIEQQIANIEIPSLDGYATEDYVNQKEQAIQTWVNNKEFATQEDVANIDFYDIKDNPIINNGDGKLIFADEQGNIGLQLEADNTLYVKDVVAGDDVLSNKMDITDNLVRIEDADGELDDVPEDVYVKYVTQSLTDEQKNQVRENLGIDEIYKHKEYTITLDGDEICDYYAINNLGNAVLADGYGCSSFIPCYGCVNMKYTNMQLTSSKNYGLSFYDVNKNFISYVPSLVGDKVDSITQIVDVPVNAHYFKATYFNYATQVTVGEFHCEMTFKDNSLYSEDGKRPYQDGFIYFSQKVNQSITKYWETSEVPQNDATYKVTTGVVALPKTYKQTGRKTPLILYAHGLSHYVYYGTWGNTDTFRQQKQHWLDMGFAVMDCNGARDNNRKGQFASGICPQGVNGYKLCVEYILKNYNIDPEIFVVAGSAGGAIGWNYLSMYGQTVKSAVFISAYADLKADAYGGGGQKNLYTEFLGFNNASTYEVDKTIGFDPALKLITINGTKYCFDYYHTPIYGLYGSKDTYSLITSHKNMFAALRNAGATAQIRKIEGVGHEIVSGANIIVDAEVGNWLLSHYSKFDAKGIDITYHNIKYIFIDENGNNIQSDVTTKVVNGTSINFTQNAPTFEGYEFISVSPTSSVINSDITVTYTYNKLDSYTVTYVYLNSEGQSIKDNIVMTEYEGTEIDFTAKAPIIQGFNFVSVVPTSSVINSDITVTYTYEAIPTHEVTYVFVNENDEEISDRIIEIVNEGTEIDFTTKAIEIIGYRLDEVYPENGIVNEDMIVTFKYYEVSENDVSHLFTWNREKWMAVKQSTGVQFKTSSYFMSCFTDMTPYIGSIIKLTVPEYTASNGASSTGRTAWFTQPIENTSYFHTLIKEWDMSTHGNAKGVLTEVTTIVPAEAPYLWTSTYMDGVESYVGPNSGREDFYCYIVTNNTHSVTFKCVDTDGNKIGDDIIKTFADNEYIEFINHAPIINGYIFDNVSVENAYIDSDMTIICTYRIANETDITNLFVFDIPSTMVTNTNSNLDPGSSNFQSSSNFMSCFTDLSAYVGKEIRITLPEYKNSAGSISNGVTLWMTEPTQSKSAVYSVAKKWDKYDGNNGTGILTEHILTVPDEAPYLWTSTYMDGVSAYVGPNSGTEDFKCYVLD